MALAGLFTCSGVENGSLITKTSIVGIVAWPTYTRDLTLRYS